MLRSEALPTRHAHNCLVQTDKYYVDQNTMADLPDVHLTYEGKLFVCSRLVARHPLLRLP